MNERQRLADYLEELRTKAIVLEYPHAAELVGHLNSFLSRATGQFQQDVQSSKNETPQVEDPSVGVWPRSEIRENPRTDNRGRIRTQRNWSLVLHNTSPGPASDVDFAFTDLPEGSFLRVVQEDGPLGTIPPGQEIRLPLIVTMGSPESVDCEVTWTDTTGSVRTTRATVRI